MTGGVSESRGPQSGVRLGAPVATVDRRGVWTYLLVTFGVAWAAEAVIALTGGLATPMARLALPALMFAPMLGSWVVCRRTRRPWASAVGLTRDSWASGGWKRILLTVLVGMVMVLALGVATIALAAACGWLPKGR